MTSIWQQPEHQEHEQDALQTVISALIQAAETEYQFNCFNEARIYFELALTLSPDDTEIWQRYAKTLQWLTKEVGSKVVIQIHQEVRLRCQRQYGDTHYKMAECLNSLGCFYLREEQFDRATEELGKALTLLQTYWQEHTTSIHTIERNLHSVEELRTCRERHADAIF